MSIEAKSAELNNIVPRLPMEQGVNDDPAYIQMNEIVSSAEVAEKAEREMTLFQGLRKYPSAVFWSMAISTTLVMEGFDTNLLSNLIALPSFREKFGRPAKSGKGYQLDPAWQSAIGYAPTIGACCGILIFSWMQQHYGYRRTIQLNLVLVTAFIFIVFFAPSIQVLFVGEFLCGLPWGAFSSSAVSYASEVAPVPLRGYLTIYVSLCWIIGQFLGSGVIYATHDWTSDLAYKLPFALQWMWPLPLFILVTIAPESPWFLVRKGKYAEAEKSISRLTNKSNEISPKETVAMMVRTVKQEDEVTAGASYIDCFKGIDLRRTEIVCMTWASTNLVGAAFANHPAYFLQQAGFSTSNSLQLDLGLRGMAFVATMCSWIVMSFFGRRKTILVGESLLVGTLLLCAILSFPGDKKIGGTAWAEAAMTFIWVCVWDASVTTTAYAVVGEASSTRLRGKTVGLARIFYNSIGIPLGIINTYGMNPDAWNWKGRTGFFFAGSAMVALIWAYFRLPECKGRTYRDIDLLFQQKVPANKFRTNVIEEQSGSSEEEK